MGGEFCSDLRGRGSKGGRGVRVVGSKGGRGVWEGGVREGEE